MLNCIGIRTRWGIYSQIYSFALRSSWRQSPRELLKAKRCIWPYIRSKFLIRTKYHFNSHRANNSLISLIDNYSVYSLGSVLWNIPPWLEVILKELNLSIQSFRMIYCIRNRTRQGIYGQIYPLREGVPEGTPEGKGLHLTIYPPSRRVES